MLKIHHLSCGSMCPYGGKLMDGTSHGLEAHLVCHCLAIETDDGLVLVDTGFGVQDIRHPKKRLSPFFINFNRIQFDEDRTALRQIEGLGFNAEDVRHIVLTHLDFDHAGGITDFPLAKVHLHRSELWAATQPRTWLDRNRYRPQQWDTEHNWVTYKPEGDTWFGFKAVRDLMGLPPEILLVPLAGHTWGHSGVAVQTDEGWLLHAGDAYFFHGEISPNGFHCPLGLRLYQSMMEKSRYARLTNQRRLRDLNAARGDKIRIFSAHDALELAAFAQPETSDTPLRSGPATQVNTASGHHPLH